MSMHYAATAISSLPRPSSTSAEAPGRTLAMMTLRYLRAVRVGPAVATATTHGDLAEITVRDGGRDDVLAVLATTRCFGTEA